MSDHTEQTLATGGQLLSATSTSGELACMMLQLESSQLIVPTVTVAEMSPVRRLADTNVTADWLLGYYVWRQINVPVIAYDYLNGRADSRVLSPHGRIAVLNNTGVSEKLPFIAIHTQGIPKMLKVSARDIGANESAEAGKFDTMCVSVQGQTMVIPDIKKLEEHYLALAQQS